MERESSSDHLRSHETSHEAIDTLPEHLGFVESEELKAIRGRVIEAAALGDTESVRSLLLEYQLLAEETVDAVDAEAYMRAQIGLIIARATLHRDIKDIEAFLDHIRDAKDYAFNLYDDETVAVLEKAPSIEIARILAVLGDEYGFDDETLVEIAAKPYIQAFEIAYGYLTQAGLDADEVLDAFIKDTETYEVDSE